jgi:hypothetical protein
MESAADRSRAHSRRLGSLAMVAIGLFALVCTTSQVVRDDLDWTLAPLSFYLVGAYGAWVKAAYFALGTGLLLLGLGYYQALGAAARSGAPLLLFSAAGIALGVTALVDSHTSADTTPMAAWVHGLAASTAFLSVTVAMLLQAVRLRRDAAWRHRFALAFSLAVACFVAMWVHALWREAPRGLTQKIVIALIVAWLWMAATWLRQDRGGRVMPARAGPSTGELP